MITSPDSPVLADERESFLHLEYNPDWRLVKYVGDWARAESTPEDLEPGVLTGAVGMAAVGVGLGRDARFLEEMGTSEDTRRLLDSNFAQEKLQGIKCLMGMQSLGKDVSPFFADVVKNVTVNNMELKKLVYMYLVQFAGDQPDLALLSVNSFQKDLSDPNQLIRALALRVMAAIRVPLIKPLVLMAVQKCATDSSSHVRRAVAHALPNLARPETRSAAAPSAGSEGGETEAEAAAAAEAEAEEERELGEDLITVLEKLLGDPSAAVLSSAASAFVELAPSRLDLLHPHFHKVTSRSDEPQ